MPYQTHEDKGFGLDEILTILDQRGFLRIRSVETCVYRNLISHPYTFVQDVDQMVLFDWKTNSEDRFTKLKESQGAVITIVYPLVIDGSK